MAVKLGQVLLERKLITRAQLEDALKAQLIYGGRLGTNLVELGYLDVDQLGRVMSELLKVPLATPEQLDAAPDDVVAMISKDVAAKYVAMPFALEGRKLKVALGDPLNPMVLDAVAFASGKRIDPHVVPELRLYFYLERRYGIVRDVHYIRLAPERPVSPELRPSIERDRQAASSEPTGTFESSIADKLANTRPVVNAEDRAELFGWFADQEFLTIDPPREPNRGNETVRIRVHAPPVATEPMARAPMPPEGSAAPVTRAPVPPEGPAAPVTRAPVPPEGSAAPVTRAPTAPEGPGAAPVARAPVPPEGPGASGRVVTSPAVTRAAAGVASREASPLDSAILGAVSRQDRSSADAEEVGAREFLSADWGALLGPLHALQPEALPPTSLEEAQKALDGARREEGVALALLDFCRRRVRRTLIWVERMGTILLWRGRAELALPPPLEALRLEASEASTFLMAAVARRAVVLTEPRLPLDLELLAALGDRPAEVLVVPIFSGGDPAMFLWVDCGPAQLSPEVRSGLEKLGPAASSALERIALERRQKKGH